MYQLTDIGRRMATMPISARNSRMIIEAEKYGVVTDVLTLAAILEVGSLMKPKQKYPEELVSPTSALLTELAIFKEYAPILSTIDFRTSPLNGKRFRQVMEIRNKFMREWWNRIEFTSTGDEEDILRACLYGMIDSIFINQDGNKYIAANGTGELYYLDRNSGFVNYPAIVFAKTHVIEKQDEYGCKKVLRYLVMPSAVAFETLKEIMPNHCTTEEYSCTYNEDNDCVHVYYHAYFDNYFVKRIEKSVHDHPRYQELKADYERRLERQKQIEAERKAAYEARCSIEAKRQKNIIINGVVHDVIWEWSGKPKVVLYSYDVLDIEQERITLDDGTALSIECIGGGIRRTSHSVSDLKNWLENVRIAEGRKQFEKTVSDLSGNKYGVVKCWSHLLGKQRIAKTNSGDPVYVFAYLVFDGKTFRVKVTDDEEKAAADSKEATKLLFEKAIMPKLSHKNFMIIGHEGKKVLTKKGSAALEEFKEWVKLYSDDVTLENFEASLAELNEMYESLVKSVSAA